MTVAAMKDINLSSAGTGEQMFDSPTSTKKSAKTPKVSLNTGEIREMILACRDEAEDTYRDIRDTWNNCWDMYRNFQDYSKKADWQSKVFIPELNPAVKKATSLLRRILVQAGDYYDIVDPLNPSNVRDTTIIAQKKALKYHLDLVKFDTVLMHGIESGFTFGTGALKIWWEPKEKSRIEARRKINMDNIFSPRLETYFEEVTWMSSGLAAKAIDPRQLYFDPDHTFIIEETIASLPDIQALSMVKMPDGTWYYDPGQVKKLANTDYGTDAKEVERLQKLGLVKGQNQFKKSVNLKEYWGPVYDRYGRIVKKNARVVLANDMYVLNPQNIENPFRFYGALYGKPPYVIFSPIDYLFRLEGQSLIEGAISLQKAINNITNMSLDGLLWKLMKLFEIDPDRLRHPDALKSLRPGKPILVNKGDGPAIREAAISDIPRGSIEGISILRKALQNSDFVTDFLLALDTRNTTATEYAGSSRESNAMFESIGRNLEEGLIEPAIEMAKQETIQYWDDFNDPVLQQIATQFGPPFSAQSREERLAFMLKSSYVQSRGISSYFEKASNLKKFVDFLGVAKNIPSLIKRLEWREWGDRIISCFSFDNPAALLVSEEKEQEIVLQEKQEEQAKMENLRMQAQAFDMKKNESQARLAGATGPTNGGGKGGTGPVSPKAILAALAAQTGRGPSPEGMLQ